MSYKLFLESKSQYLFTYVLNNTPKLKNTNTKQLKINNKTLKAAYRILEIILDTINQNGISEIPSKFEACLLLVKLFLNKCGIDDNIISFVGNSPDSSGMSPDQEYKISIVYVLGEDDFVSIMSDGFLKINLSFLANFYVPKIGLLCYFLIKINHPQNKTFEDINYIHLFDYYIGRIGEYINYYLYQLNQIIRVSEVFSATTINLEDHYELIYRYNFLIYLLNLILNNISRHILPDRGKYLSYYNPTDNIKNIVEYLEKYRTLTVRIKRTFTPGEIEENKFCLFIDTITELAKKEENPKFTTVKNLIENIFGYFSTSCRPLIKKTDETILEDIKKLQKINIKTLSINIYRAGISKNRRKSFKSNKRRV